MSRLRVPTISVISGEGGSGGALVAARQAKFRNIAQFYSEG
jgi:acetyl-CoA carboxylase alpha subunit